LRPWTGRSWRDGAGSRPLALLCLCVLAPHGPAPEDEYKIKAKMLQQLVNYIGWPEEALGGPGASFVVGVLGDDPFGDHLDRELEGRSVKDHKIVIRRLGGYERLGERKPLEECHLLFVGASEREHLERILESVRHRSTFTVGDTDDFTAMGGILRFYEENRRLRLEINLTALADATLTASAQLLKLARLVR
jgi:hypothetical protein